MKRWWILKDRLRHGPFTEAELSEHLKAGRFDVNDFAAPEGSQGVTQLSHRTIREVLSHLAVAVPVVTIEAAAAAPERRNHETRPDDIDGMPGIRDLIAKIEAVELVDSNGRNDDNGLQVQAVHHSKSKDLFDSFSELFRRAAPALGVLAALGLAFAFFTKDGGFEVAPSVAQNDEAESGRRPASPARSNPVPASRAQQSAPRVNVPKMSERSVSGFEHRAVVPEIEQRNMREDLPESEGTEPESSRTADGIEMAPDRSIAARRERLKRLRNSMAPDTAPTPGEAPVPGIAEDNESQQGYDQSRDPSSDIGQSGQSAYESEEAPYVEPDEMVAPEETRDSVDENVDVEYQE